MQALIPTIKQGLKVCSASEVEVEAKSLLHDGVDSVLLPCAGNLWTATLKDGSGRAAVRRVIASDNSCLFNAVGYVMERSRDRAPELRYAPVSVSPEAWGS